MYRLPQSGLSRGQCRYKSVLWTDYSYNLSMPFYSLKYVPYGPPQCAEPVTEQSNHKTRPFAFVTFRFYLPPFGFIFHISQTSGYVEKRCRQNKRRVT